MEPVVVLAVLGAALLHASWHALVKSSGDGITALAGMNLVSGVAALACLPFVDVPAAPVFTVIAVSVCLHVGYKVGLARLYARSDLSQGYPLARGMTPLAAALLAFLFLGERPAFDTMAGIVAISAGLALLVLEGGRRSAGWRTVCWAAVVGVAVAAYSTLDAYGVRLNGDWLGFTAWLIACDSAAFVGYAYAMKGRALSMAWRAAWARTLASGILGLLSFCVFMWALGRAAVAPVAALRETSILFAALIGAAVLKERAGPARYLSAVLVMVGVALVSFSR